MGNQTSVPREPYVNQKTSYDTMVKNVNQSRQIGNPDPVIQSATSAMLKTASPKGFDLSELTNADVSDNQDKAARCREYQNLGGLRRLINDTGSRTAYEPGCGWIYAKNGTNRGALGGEGDPSNPHYPRAPVFSRQSQDDEVKGGERFFMDLERAENVISADMVRDIHSCRDMAAIASDPTKSRYVGYCKSSGRIIPVQRNEQGVAQARFLDDVEFRCSSSDIITPQNTSSCPAPGTGITYSRTLGTERFTNFDDAFRQPTWALQNQQAMTNRNGSARRNEGFAVGVSSTDTEFERCRVRERLGGDSEAKQCVVNAATYSGFGVDGAFLKYLSGGVSTPIFDIYKRLLPSTDFIPSEFQNNKYNINELIRIFSKVKMNISHSNREIATAARDIVLESGAYSAEYNLCGWFAKSNADTTTISRDDPGIENCMQNYWKNAGGDSRGIEFPTLSKWEGKTIGTFKQSFATLTNDVRSMNMDNQSLAISKKYGVNTYNEVVKVESKAPPQACEMEKNGTEGTCPATVQRGNPIPTYIQKWKVTKPAIAGGTACPHPERETKQCDTIICDPVDCEGRWEESPCSETCGKGTKTLTYRIQRNASCGGKQCEANDGETKPPIECMTRECGPNDCQYTASITQDCPADLSSPQNCGRQFYRITSYAISPNNRNNALQNCPAPNPNRSECPVVQCPELVPATVDPCEVIVYYEKWYKSRPESGYPAFTRYTVGSYQYPHGSPTPLPPDGRTFLSPGNGQTGVNDAIRSIRVGSDVTVTVYRHFLGQEAATFSSDTPDLGGLNDQVSSLVVNYKPGGRCVPTLPSVPECQVWAYYEKNYGTRAGFPSYTILSTGDYNYHTTFIKSNEMYLVTPGQPNTKPIDDAIQSIRVGSGVKITLFADNFSGITATYTSDVPNLNPRFGIGYGSGITSLKIEKRDASSRCFPMDPDVIIVYYETEYRTRAGFPEYTIYSVGRYNYPPSSYSKNFLDPTSGGLGGTGKKGARDAIRSIRVGNNVKVTVYENDYYNLYSGGKSKTYTSDSPDLQELNDLISSLEVMPK